MRIPDPAVFLNADPDPDWNKFVIYYLMKSVLELKKKLKYCSKVKNHGAGSNFPPKKLDYNYCQFQCIFSVFSLNFSLLDPDQHIECGSGSWRKN